MLTPPLSALSAFAEQIDRQRGEHASPLGDAESKKLSAAYLKLGKTMIEAGHIDEGLACHDKALGLRPDDLDLNYTALFMLERLNRIEQAWAAMLSLEARLGGLYESSKKLFILKARLEYRRGNRAVCRAMLEKFLAENPAHSHRYLAYGWLGKLLDELGEYDAAMAAFDGKNAALLNNPGAAEHLRQNDAELAAIDTSLDWYRGQTGLGWQAADTPAELGEPILLAGFPRSGTTLLDQILDAHSGLAVVEERPLLAGIAGRFFDGADKLAALRDLSGQDIDTLRRTYWSNAADILGQPLGGCRMVDKLPLNIMHLDIYARLFPGIKIVVALRDPRDVILSNHMQLYQLNPSMAANLSLERSARYYAKVMGLYLLFRERLAGQIHEIRYERLVFEPRQECAKLLRFLGLEWEEGIERFHENARHRRIATPSYDQVTRPIHRDAVARWTNYAPHLEAIQPTLQPFVEAFGYAR